MQCATYTLPGKAEKEGLITFREGAIPIWGTNDVLIKVYSCSINPVDYKLVAPYVPIARWFNHTHYGVGSDISGVIIDVGDKVTKVKIGDEVLGCAGHGALQEYTKCHENNVYIKPSNTPFNKAAGILLAGGTSYQSLKWFYPNDSLKDKDVLIIGGSGGCGSHGLMIAKYLKVKTLCTVCSSKNTELVKKLGADIVIEYDKPNSIDQIKDIKFDLIYDTVTSPEDSNLEEIYSRFLKGNDVGKYVGINGNRWNMIKGFFCVYFWNISKYIEKKNYHINWLYRNKHEDLVDLVKISSCNPDLLPIEEFEFSKNGIDAAFKKLKSRRVKGKIIINICNEKGESKKDN